MIEILFVISWVIVGTYAFVFDWIQKFDGTLIDLFFFIFLGSILGYLAGGFFLVKHLLDRTNWFNGEGEIVLIKKRKK